MATSQEETMTPFGGDVMATDNAQETVTATDAAQETSAIPTGEQKYTAIAIKGMPATMHHKCAPDRAPTHGAAVMGGVAMAALGHRASVAVITGIATEIQARGERDYMLKVRSQAQYKASQNDNVGGFIMLWLDQNAAACRFGTAKYDAVALPIRNHSPFTYPEMKLKARRQMDGNLCSYTIKLICLLVLVSFMVFGVVQWYVLTQYKPKMTHSGESVMYEGMTPQDLAEEAEEYNSILMIVSVVMLGWIFLLVVMTIMTLNCLFYSPLRKIVSQLNKSPFWKQRGVKFSLTNPGKGCCCQSARKHCIVVQYGLNGKAMV